MDPDLQTPVQVVPDANTLGKQIPEASRSFVRRHYEDYLRFVIRMMFWLINFIKFSITNIIAQVFNKE